VSQPLDAVGRQRGRMILGLRIDVCTYEGLRTGVPNLLPLLARFGARATFFVALGPDRSGRAVFRMLQSGFLEKMCRTKAVRTYGWRTILSGTLLPARNPAGLASVLRAIPNAGHELAMHGYDHRRWQDRLRRMRESEVRDEMARALQAYERVLGRRPQGSGAPGWQCGPNSLRAVDECGLAYASDTRGRRPFFPLLNGARLRTLQVPTTFPTLDEVVGLEGADGDGFLALIARGVERDPWPVLTLHAEMEGRRFLGVAEQLFAQCAVRQVDCIPLAELATLVRRAEAGRIPHAEIADGHVKGRAGCVAMPVGLEPNE
jgi:undecaprenyl phosphate-alpha-L-ara4FN deformylase